MSKRGESLVRVEFRKVWTELGEPRGRPSRVVPLSQGEKGMCWMAAGSEGGDEGEERMHLPSFTFRSVG